MGFSLGQLRGEGLRWTSWRTKLCGDTVDNSSASVEHAIRIGIPDADPVAHALINPTRSNYVKGTLSHVPLDSGNRIGG
jgi:hypothetical protein